MPTHKKPLTISTDGWSGYSNLTDQGYTHELINLSQSWGDASLSLPAIHLVLGLTHPALAARH